MGNLFHFEKSFGVFVGKLIENKLHKHYYQQISVSSETDMALFLPKQDIIGKAFFINSNISHKLISNTTQLTILINPLTPIGHQLHLKFGQIDYVTLNNLLTKNLQELIGYFIQQKTEFSNLCKQIALILDSYKCNCELENHLDDDRIAKAIDLMDKDFEKVFSLEEVADFCSLSSTRFLHLFKEKTNLNFRRYQLSNKLIKSLPYLLEHSITHTAYTFGFSDSSHYTKTFIETFGVTPKFLLSKK